MIEPHKEFGSRASGVRYELRPGGYAVVRDAAGLIAVVGGPSGCILPGGGQEAGESPEQAVTREAREECGLRLRLTRRLCGADELLFAAAESRHFCKRCVFFAAEPVGRATGGELDLLWLTPDEAIARLRHESQRWAVAVACDSPAAGSPATPTLFAPYEPGAGRRRATRPASIRPARRADLAAIVRLLLERDGGTLDAHHAGLERQLGEGDDRVQLLVAECDGAVAGFARSARFRPPPDSRPGTAPAGWYLAGLVVAPEHRRQGIGLALTRERLRRLAARARCVYYFGSVVNRATIDLHRKAGFVEITRDFVFPGVTFTGGVGVLCRVDVEPGAEPRSSDRPEAS